MKRIAVIVPVIFGCVVLVGIVIVVLTRVRAPVDSEGARSTDLRRSSVLGDSQKLPKLLKNSIGMDMVPIPDGDFAMGAPKQPEPAEDARKSFADASPGHNVRITRSFYLGIHEVTQKEYQAVVGTNSSANQGVDADNMPVDSVSWFEAIEFCNRLSMKERLMPYYKVDGERVTINGGRGYRLPTEAEWEYACRAGSQSIYAPGNREGDWYRYAWIGSNSEESSHPVGQKDPNSFGLYDMIGNVGEWCWDWHGAYNNDHGILIDPTGPTTGDKRITRGGNYTTLKMFQISPFCRSAFDPGRGIRARGFRVARNAS